MGQNYSFYIFLLNVVWVEFDSPVYIVRRCEKIFFFKAVVPTVGPTDDSKPSDPKGHTREREFSCSKDSYNCYLTPDAT